MMDGAENFLLSDEFLKKIDEYSNSKIHKGNHVDFFPSGAESYKKRWELIENAKKSIHIVSFSIMNDGTSKKLKNILVEKLKQGLDVKLIFDDSVLKSTFSKHLLREVEKKSGELILYNKLWQGWIPEIKRGHPFKQIARNAKLKLKKHFHEKYMIIDSRYAILGGINWGDKYAFGGIKPKAWRDSDVYLSGPVVSDIQYQFLKDFTRYKIWNDKIKKNIFPDYNKIMRECDYLTKEYVESKFPQYFPALDKQGNYNVRYISHKPYDNSILNLTDTFLYTIKNAKNYIYWGCHGIRPPYIIGEYFADAAARGVEIRLITNSRKSATTLMLHGLLGRIYLECTKHYKWLLERGVKIYEWQNPGAFHSKNIVIDDVFAAVGSYNIARGSAYHHTESDIIIHGGDMPLKIKNQFNIDFQFCKEIKLDEIKHKLPKLNAFDRPLSERDFLISKDLLTDTVKDKLAKGYYKRILT